MGNVASMAGVCSQQHYVHCTQTIVEPDIRQVRQGNTDPVAWFALAVHQYKRSQCEQMLTQLGYEYFSPCAEVVRAWSDRSKRMQIPLFPGYIFCRFDPQERLALLHIPGVLRIVGSGSRFLAVDAEEIEAIKLAVASKLPMEPHAAIIPGQKVKVVHGLLAGVRGVLVRIKAESRLLLSVSMLNRCVSLEIEAHQLVHEN